MLTWQICWPGRISTIPKHFCSIRSHGQSTRAAKKLIIDQVCSDLVLTSFTVGHEELPLQRQLIAYTRSLTQSHSLFWTTLTLSPCRIRHGSFRQFQPAQYTALLIWDAVGAKDARSVQPAHLFSYSHSCEVTLQLVHCSLQVPQLLACLQQLASHFHQQSCRTQRQGPCCDPKIHPCTRQMTW